MTSSTTSRLRLEKQGTGENLNTWGDRLNTALDLLDEAIGGVEPITISGASTVLTSTNYVSDQARNAVLVLTGTLTANSTITVPSVEKTYLVVDNTTRAGFTLTIKTSGGSGYALRPGPQAVYCDGVDVFRGVPRLDQLPLPTSAVDLNGQRLTNIGAPTAGTDAATRQYVDGAAFSMAAGSLPGQAGNAGKFLSTDGAAASWKAIPNASQAETDAGTADDKFLTPLKVATAYMRQGRHTLVVLADGMRPQLTNGPAVSVAEMTTNKQMVVSLDFDAATAEYAQVRVPMPKSWNEGTITAQFVWSHGTAATNFAVVWAMQAVAVSDDDTLDASWGAAATVTDTGGTANDLYISPETSALTIGGTPAEGDVVWFRVYRDATNVADTLAADAKLIAVKLFLTYNAGNDA